MSHAEAPGSAPAAEAAPEDWQRQRSACRNCLTPFKEGRKTCITCGTPIDFTPGAEAEEDDEQEAGRRKKVEMAIRAFVIGATVIGIGVLLWFHPPLIVAQGAGICFVVGAVCANGASRQGGDIEMSFYMGWGFGIVVCLSYWGLMT